MKLTAYSKQYPEAKILLQHESELPSGYTLIKPLEPKEGFTVEWSEELDNWDYVSIPVQEEVTE
jgi:hypothetical protein